MAYSVQKTKWSQNNPTERVKTNEFAGRVRIAYATYEASAEQSTIEMFNLPNGARIIRGYLGHDALGSSTTLSVGYAAHTTSAGATVALDVDEYKAAAASTADANAMTAFNADGFSVGSTDAVNKNATSLISWNWKAGTTSGLSGGTITPSAYSINTTTKFGIYKYTGNATSGATIAHGLGVAPKFLIT